MIFFRSCWSLILLVLAMTNGQEICTSTNNMFHVRVDLFASELGQYTFDECGDVVNPTLGIEVNQPYTFVQADRSNYFHPLGFTNAQMTFYQGTTVMDQYAFERRFEEHPFAWSSYDEFSIQVQFSELSQEPYYFCYIHQFMEGSIQLLQNGVPLTPQGAASANAHQVVSSPFVDSRSEFDKQCGTFGLGDFQLPNPFCPDRFVCGTEDVTDELQQFAACLDAANCAMMSGMTTGVQATADSALFIHQMIPHHQNAVNTAKSLLKMGSLLCPDLTDQTNPDCVLESILREIIANQNHQIQLMRRFLTDHRYPQEDNCDVYVETVEYEELFSEEESETSSGVRGFGSWTAGVFATVGSCLLLGMAMM